MGTVTVEQAMQSLYDRLSKPGYTQTAHWTTAKTFTPAYQKIDKTFVPDLLMNNKHEFVPTPVEEIGTAKRNRTSIPTFVA